MHVWINLVDKLHFYGWRQVDIGFLSEIIPPNDMYVAVSPLEETQWSRGVSCSCARAWTLKVIRPLLNVSGYLFPAWKTQNAKIIIKNDHGSVANRCYKANDFRRSFLVVIRTYFGRTTVWLMYSTLLVKIHFISYIPVRITTKIDHQKSFAL